MASKNAVWRLIDDLRQALPDFIVVGMIALGFVGSELIPEPLQSVGMPEDEFAAIILQQMLAG